MWSACYYRPSLKMKTDTIILIFLMNLLIGGLCASTCTVFGEGTTTTTNEGRVTLQVKVNKEIEEIHWVNEGTHNVFFHIFNSCKFQKCCCQIEDPKNCCRIQNKTYETKLCSCHISSLSSSISFCNLTREDEGWLSANIHAKNNQNTICKFELHIPGENDQPAEPPDHTILIIALVSGCLIVIMAVALIIKFREKIRSWWKRIRGHDVVVYRRPTSSGRDIPTETSGPR